MKHCLELLTLSAASLISFALPPANAAIILYDGTLAQAITTNDGASTATYAPATKYALVGYNTANISYTEVGVGDKYLEVVNDLGTLGGLDGVLRYSFVPANVKSWVNGTATAENFLTDIASNPVLSFDITYLGDSTFGSVQIDINSNTVGAPSVILLTQALAANTPTSVSLTFSQNTAWTNWLTQMGAAATPGSAAQLRILVQTGTGDPGTFQIDNIQISSIPETSSAAAVMGLGITGFVALRRRRGVSAGPAVDVQSGRL